MIGKKSGHNILVVSDTAKEVADIKYLLSAHFEHVRFSIDEEEVLEHLGQLLPDVLILAFTRIEQAEQFYLRLYRSKSVMSGHFHQTILLCTSRESRKAFQLCRTGIFDEYVVDRPLYDPQRITLSIEQAMSRLSIQRQVASLQEKLRKSKQGVSPFETTMFERISVCNNQHQNMKELVDHIASDLGIQGGQLKDKVEGACQTLGEIHSEFAHHIETSSLNGQMKTIMLVDDDEFYREQIIGILAQEGYQILEADNGAAALNLLQMNQPDLILLARLIHQITHKTRRRALYLL